MSQAGILNVNGGGGGGSPVNTITGNSGGPVPPTANNINLLGSSSGLLTVVGNPGTSTLTINPTAGAFPITPYVVGPVGIAGYQTIQSAINAAVLAGGNSAAIYVQGQISPYTENLDFSGTTVLTNGLTMVGVGALGDQGQVEIIGHHTPPSTGTLVLRNFKLSDATHIFTSAAAGSAHLTIIDALLNVTNGYTFDLLNWTGIFELYDINGGTLIDGLVNNTGGAQLYAFSASLGSGTGQTMQLRGVTLMQNTSLACPVNFGTGSSIAYNNVIFKSVVTFANNSTGTLNLCTFADAASSPITMSSTAAITIQNGVINSSNTTAIAGAGTGLLSLGDITFQNKSNIASTINIAYLGNDSVNAVSNYNDVQLAGIYTATPSDYYICFPTGIGPCIVLLPNTPSKGRVFIIKDRDGKASTNNLSITTPNGVATFDGQTTYKLTANYESVNVVFNGTNYEVF